MLLLKDLLTNKNFYLICLCLIIGFGGGIYFNKYTAPVAQGIDPKVSEFHAGGYKYISPLYECSTGKQYASEKLNKLESAIQQFVDKIIADNSTMKASVYFRNLSTGAWFGVNEHDYFAPSSLLKTPVMMAYFKKAEDDPSILTQKIKYDKDPDGLIPQNFKPENPIAKGQSYTVEQLIERMIEGSDNVALRLLENYIGEAAIDQVTIDLGITTATNATPTDFMDVQEYSTLFRVLYNSTYLNTKYSEKALDILSRSEFTQGLVASVPNEIVVSHKFGERKLTDGINELHDCGIIYYPKRPYLLCVMSKGPDFNGLLSTIQQISQKIYSQYKTRYPQN